MDLSLFLIIVAAAICFVFLRKLRFDQENQEIEPSSSLSPSSPPSLSSSLSLSPPTSSSHNWIHDVFPSFRGEDVRVDFLSHIQKEFRRKGITPFIDNNIKRGESIGPELVRAIRGSKIAIILLSKNYASSKWCLDELVEIMKCKEELGQIVMAIFYKVDPSDIKKLAGNFGKVFEKTCEGKSKKDIERWTQALVKVATIAGYDSSNWDNEATMIEKIATDVLLELINSAPSSDFDYLVGMGAHRENMEPFLHLDSNEVKMIGIWGPSGIGKSTIARVLYSKYAHQFQHSVFMQNIKIRYPRPCYDEYSAKLQLQKDFLSQIINYEDIKDPHLGVAQDRLKDKRVFVVLDDVDHRMQLEAIVNETRWFGPGSRIIITTQDKEVLTAHGVNHIYKVDFPLDDEALQIFCMYAFDQKYPYDGFEKLAWEVTQLAGKLPLGLKIMGSYLKRMPIEKWKKELPRLKTSLDGEIQSIFEISYNALRAEDKELFLYIACIFNNERNEKVEAHLANNFTEVSQGLRILAEKSLISVTGSGDIAMHDLLARFGRDIDRRQYSQFLVDARDISKVLNNKAASRGSVIGAVINISEISEIEDELSKCYNAVESMSCLQFLRLSYKSPPRNVLDWQYFRMTWLVSKFNPYRNLTQILKNLQVRLLDWQYFPMSFLPSEFNPEFLVELKMRSSKLEEFWSGNKTIKNLKWMNLSGSYNLRKLPDLSTATNLHQLDLSYCRVLRKLPSSIGNAINLKELNLRGCKSLMELPSSIGNITSLEKLNLSGCSSLRELPSSIGNVTSLKKCDLRGCSSLMELPSSIGNVTSLEKLDLRGCESLMELPSSIGNVTSLEKLNLNGCSSLRELPSSIGNAINLKELNLFGCSSLMELPSSIGNVTSLEKLNLNGCSSLRELPSSIGNVTSLEKLNLSFTSLRELHLRGCKSLMELPSSIGNAINLKELNLESCSSLMELPSSIGNAINLKELNLESCSSLMELPSSIGNVTSLEKLDLSFTSLRELPSSIGNAINLKELNLFGCSSLMELPSSIGNVTSLEKLNLSFTSLRELPSSIGNAINLKELNLNSCSSLRKLPSSIGNAINLTELDLCYCSSLEELPSSIGNVTSLRELVISGCTKLVSLPQLPASLETLYAGFCESLERLHCSFHNTRFVELNFANCFKLNQEARDLIIKASTSCNAFLPGEKVPPHFTYRAFGSSCSIKLNGTDTHLPTSLTFKACFLPVNKGDVEVYDWEDVDVTYRIVQRQNGISLTGRSDKIKIWASSKKHLYIYEFEEEVSSSGFVFEVEAVNEKFEIAECGISILSCFS